ncbi:hypothetical protein B9G98_02046 [Wickerhamiella sorbophila]|uniref:Major facilitator superfamily (MFS) profile domain-containing protein n=1 Tax=Wickerhamiella sorbophila TaxID=45607 RepID=A0A2T0FHH1_9ASCO|nr:hypothetical protein B9G98_02046 [Wickerhamiella sorbophila]PRT54426.1 hypothetical protein B9G98_02046 [Wickerhamiella sorbophila]
MSAVKRYCTMVRNETSLPKWLGGSSDDGTLDNNYADSTDGSETKEAPAADVQIAEEKPKAQYWAIVATGAGLFSDGYVNSTVGFVTTMLKRIYGAKALSKSSAMSNISAIAFAGTVVGQLGFGFLADHHSRKIGMIISTGILIVFSILLAGSYGIGMPTNPQGMLAAMTVYRAFLGIGIGGEYPAGSVACAEVSQKLSKGSRNRYFVWFTNSMIDFGFVMSAFIAWLLLYICSVPSSPDSDHGLSVAWRVLYGLGAIPPLSLLYLRLKFQDDEQFTKNSLKHIRTPYWTIFKYYGPRMILVSLIWFIYDFCTYSFGIFSPQIIGIVVKDNNIHTTFGWNTLFYVFYLPGTLLGAFASDYFGPRLTLFTGAVLQGIVGFIMTSQYATLIEHAAPFIVVFGVFTALGEFGPGNNIGLIASKSSASAIRGRYYGICAAVGKIGAFVGGYAFPAIADHYGGLDSFQGQTTLFYVSSALCIFSGLLVLLLPPLGQTAVADEDRKFREYLESQGIDTSMMGHEIKDTEYTTTHIENVKEY